MMIVLRKAKKIKAFYCVLVCVWILISFFVLFCDDLLTCTTQLRQNPRLVFYVYLISDLTLLVLCIGFYQNCEQSFVLQLTSETSARARYILHAGYFFAFSPPLFYNRIVN